MKLSLILIAAIAVGPLCSAPPEDPRPLSGVQRAAIEKAVLEADDRATLAGQERNADKLFDFMHENDKGSVVMNGNLLRTRDQARSQVRDNFRAVSQIEYRWKQRLVTVLAPEIALVVSDGESTVTSPQGSSFVASFVQTAVWMLKDGQWKILHAHQSSPRR